MLSAISYSDNIYAMKTHLFLGTDLLSKTMKRVGVKTQINQNASDALGTSEINIIDYFSEINSLLEANEILLSLNNHTKATSEQRRIKSKRSFDENEWCDPIIENGNEYFANAKIKFN